LNVDLDLSEVNSDRAYLAQKLNICAKFHESRIFEKPQRTNEPTNEPTNKRINQPQGRSDGGYMGYIYPPKIRPSKLFMG